MNPIDADRVEVAVTACGPARAAEVHSLTRAAFACYRDLDPPSGALSESPERVAGDLAAGGGAVAESGGLAVGCLRWLVQPGGELHVRRVAVAPDAQRRGIGRALMVWAEREAARLGCTQVTVGVRAGLTGNLAFYRGLGYVQTREHRHPGYDRTTWVSMREDIDPFAGGEIQPCVALDRRRGLRDDAGRGESGGRRSR